MDSEFVAALWEWRGPAPYFWLTLPENACAYVRAEAAEASYGWGAIPVRVRIGDTEWETSLLPKDGAYALPVKQAVQCVGDLRASGPPAARSRPSRLR